MTQHDSKSSSTRFPIKGARVAILSATYSPLFSYQENIWAERLSELGARVRLFCPGSLTSVHRLTPAQERASAELSADATLKTTPPQMTDHPKMIDQMPYEVEQLPTLKLPNNIYLTRSLTDALIRFRPELILWFGGIMFFGRELSRPALEGIAPVVVIYSLSQTGRHPFEWATKGLSLRERTLGLGFQVLRAPYLAQSIRSATLTVANTPEATEIIRRFIHGQLRSDWARKHVEIPLGFCSESFYYDATLAHAQRDKLALSFSQRSVLYSSRFREDKWPSIKRCFEVAERVISRDQSITFVWVGLDQSHVSSRFELLIKQSHSPNNHRLIPFQAREGLAALYRAVDVVLFPQPSISCQEAMGSGAWVLHTPDPSLDHLLAFTSFGRRAPIEEWPTTIHNRMMTLRRLTQADIDLERLDASMKAKDSLGYTGLIHQTLNQLEARRSHG
jgi:glycosyltransferase involved in cell wall biosynthesis